MDQRQSALIGFLLSTNKTIYITLIIAVGLSLASPYFFTTTNLLNVTRQVVVSGIVGFAFTLCLASRSIDLSVGSMLALVGGIVAILMKDFHFPIYWMTCFGFFPAQLAICWYCCAEKLLRTSPSAFCTCGSFGCPAA